MKYTLNSYGWSAEFIGKTITKEQTKQIEDLMEERGVEELWEVRFDLDDEMGIDIWDGDLLHITKPLNNGNISFELLDEDDKIILSFYLDKISEDNQPKDYILSDVGGMDIYLSVDENKGGIYTYEFESDVEPTINDFTYRVGFLELPDENYWSLIDEVLFKGNVMETTDILDSNGKASDLQIYKS
jgi:hypothetical protein